MIADEEHTTTWDVLCATDDDRPEVAIEVLAKAVGVPRKGRVKAPGVVAMLVELIRQQLEGTLSTSGSTGKERMASSNPIMKRV